MVEQLQIWDTAGQERFKAITQSYYRSAVVLILVYDISSTESFDSLNHWLAEIDAYAQNDALVYLVGEYVVQNNFGVHFETMSNKSLLTPVGISLISVVLVSGTCGKWLLSRDESSLVFHNSSPMVHPIF